jgi:hypothetical protein
MPQKMLSYGFGKGLALSCSCLRPIPVRSDEINQDATPQ